MGWIGAELGFARAGAPGRRQGRVERLAVGALLGQAAQDAGLGAPSGVETDQPAIRRRNGRRLRQGVDQGVQALIDRGRSRFAGREGEDA